MKHTLLAIALIVLPVLSASGQGIRGIRSEHYTFTTIGQDDGLTNDFVDDLIKDSEGYLWIATRGGGISRYDGYEFVSFNMASPALKLRSNFVGSLCEDKFGRIWVGSDSGIDVIASRTLSRAADISADSTFSKLLEQPSERIVCSSRGNIWVESGNRLLKVTFASDGSATRVACVCRFEEHEHIDTFIEIEGYIWVACGGRIYRVKEDAMSLQVPIPAASTIDLEGISVQVICRKANELWIGTSAGLYRYNLDTGLVKNYRSVIDDETTLTQNFITDIVETDDETMLVSTYRGLNLYNSLTDSFERINSDTGEASVSNYANTLGCDFVNCLLTDGDIVWVGTETGGLNKMGRRRLLVSNWQHDPVDAGSISKNPVNAVYEDPAGNLWVGTVEGGLNRRRVGSDAFEHYTSASPCGLTHNSVSCLEPDAEGRLYVGTWGGGFGWISLADLHDKRFHHVADSLYADFTSGYVGFICHDHVNQVLWIGTSENIYVYDPATQTVSEPFEGLELGGIQGCTGYTIDRTDHLWIGMTAGLCRIDLHTLRSPELSFRIWRSKLDEPGSSLKERVNGIVETADGTIWIGSNGYGFYKAEAGGDGEFTFHAYTTDDGLANNGVRGMAEDSDGRLWITTTQGLSCYDPMVDNFINYTKKDGLLSNQFYWNAIATGSDGNLYLGSIEGLSVVRTTFGAYTYGTDPPLAFTHVKVGNDDRFATDGSVTMHERDKSFTVEFASLDYDASPYAAYYYRLKGFDDEWIKATASHRTVTFTNLNPGDYTFQLRYAPDGKHWISEQKELQLHVEPYFYKTLWFMMLVVIVCALLIQAAISWRVSALKRQQAKLHQMVDEHTRQLQEEKRKVQELTLNKLSFFTNITHEFRTPLTLIAGPIERALKMTRDPQVTEQLHFAERNSHYLLSLINQLMDFRKVESGKMEITLNSCNFRSLVDEAASSFDEYAADRGITFRRCFRLPYCELMLDGEAMHKIIVNLISNALKFTPADGVITLYTTILHTADGDTLYLSVNDTGTGIDPDDLEKVFERFYQSKSAPSSSVTGQSSTGIGLYVCKQIVEMHGGRIWAKNNRKAGCSFRTLIPVTYATSALAESDKAETKVLPAAKGNTAASRLQTLPQPAGGGRKTILVVEDNKDMRDYIRSILVGTYDVLEATQGEEALDVLKSWNVDFIVCDLMMPVMDGMELSRCVKSNFNISHIPFLMLTAKTSDETRIESFKLGVDEYILKPFDDQLLLARIANILDSRKRLQQKFTYSMDVDQLNIENESEDKRFLDRAMQIVKENYKNPDYEISSFVEAMNVSKSVMNKKMQNLTGQSPGQFLRNYRLNIARELIVRNRVKRNMNISEIAYEVGFNDPKYFTRRFTKHFGTTPSSMLES